MPNRYNIKIAGETGMGLSGVGESVQKALKKMGFYIHSEREFPSTIKGGKASNSINFGTSPIHGLSNVYDIGVGLDREGVKDLLETLKPNGILIHGFDRWNKVIKDLSAQAEAKNLQVFLIPAREIAIENGGSVIMVNTVLLGVLWKVLGLDIDGIKSEIASQFKHKPVIAEVNLKCVDAGYNYNEFENIPKLKIEKPHQVPETMLVDGNTSIALGAIQAGVRAYYAYPMSPSTSILVYLAKVDHQTKMLVKQVEDEITAAQMALGSMHMGTRALTSTSGGGYDLMTETVSLAAMIETPLVISIIQRPGPATGLPTWTGQADLNLAIYSSHGEFARIVIACSDPQSCYENIQQAFNLAEKYQTPVIVLSEATIAMSFETVDIFKENIIPIERGLVINLDDLNSSDRYKITENGISTRWLPGTYETTYFANGDEHWESGEINEDADKAEQMIGKRLKKIATILVDLPEPQIFGDAANADISFVGWGSTKNAVLDAIEILKDKGIKANYLHYNYVWPLKTEKFVEFCKNNQNVNLIEGNYEGQLGNLLEGKTGIKFKNRFLKWNGRPFYVEDVVQWVMGRVGEIN